MNKPDKPANKFGVQQRDLQHFGLGQQRGLGVRHFGFGQHFGLQQLLKLNRPDSKLLWQQDLFGQHFGFGAQHFGLGVQQRGLGAQHFGLGAQQRGFGAQHFGWQQSLPSMRSKRSKPKL